LWSGAWAGDLGAGAEDGPAVLVSGVLLAILDLLVFLAIGGRLNFRFLKNLRKVRKLNCLHFPHQT